VNSVQAFLVGLVTAIIRPIIQNEINQLKDWMEDSVMQNRRFKEFDVEAESLIKQASEATTVEEVNALLFRLNTARAKLRTR